MSAESALPLVMIGGGGHARVLVDALQLDGRTVLGFTAPARTDPLAPGIDWLGDDEELERYEPATVELVNGVGSIASTHARRNVFERLSRTHRFSKVLHPAAIVAASVRTGQGVQCLAGSVLGPGVQLGDNVLVNTRSVVEHDSLVGGHAHVATGAVICGSCRIGERVHIGAAATIVQGVSIAPGTVVAAGAVVTRDVVDAALVAGVPAEVKRLLDDR